MDFNKRVGQKIRSLRVANDMTQKELADALRKKGLKTSPISISKYENGKTALSNKVALALSEIFNCSINVILEDDSKDKSIAAILREAADKIELIDR